MSSIFKKSTREMQAMMQKEISLIRDSYKIFVSFLDGKEKDVNDHKVRENEIEVNYIDKKIIEDIYFEITKGPVAKDLRRFLSYLLISKDIERVGDSTVKVLHILNKLDAEQKKILAKLFKEVVSMCNKLLVLIISEDKSSLSEEYNKDLLTHEIYSNVFKNILNLSKENKNSEFVSSFLIVVKNAERIGDYYKNVLEQLFYISTGTYISD